MYEFLVGLEVSNDEVYSDYRRAMKPILNQYGGGFGFDFRVSEVLLSQVDEPINRVFTIHFPNQNAADSFFSDSDYLAVKARYFDSSVANTTIIASYEKTA
ncbi:DUF1330 domain-containing protein [Pseudoalteromonas sp. JBTF-M23]|uniref:DUF1330 domain-containing protein n=1 Tax=Pseudoalteromonas caenipelagi TaxID=2726988 RepID=A0A849VB00_9GAMM|nr:DUF1330 domain-containing protein [Pseudoalteromonas caenipelagi]NOU49783.1 DUF1330 domain-containing protein [Pseudoalteromonas caenipelagi]